MWNIGGITMSDSKTIVRNYIEQVWLKAKPRGD